MYSLFEVKKVLSVSKPGGENGVKIKLAAYTENQNHSIIVLVCDNGYLLFRHVNTSLNAPVIRQLGWFNDPEKEIKALCFDSSGTWLLTAAKDATLYIIPIFLIIESNIKTSCWKSDNLTEIKLSGQRALTTAIQWWQTHDSEHIAIIGSELGEISFINLFSKKEVGGTYITTGILSLDILYDESHDTTYLLITGSNQQQWRLLLEEKKSNLFWPFNSEAEAMSNSGRGLPIAEHMSSIDEKNGDQRPHRLSKFESGTFLTPQCGDGRNLVSAYNSSSNLLQVLEGDLDQMHLFSYKVPPNCDSIVLSDKLIYVTSKSHSSDQHILKIVSRKLSELPTENSKKKETYNAEIQKNFFCGEILVLYKLVVQFPLSNSEEKKTDNLLLNQHRTILFNETIGQSSDDVVKEKQCLEGVIIVQKDCVWECKLRIPAEELFLSLTTMPSDLPLAEKLSISLGLDLHKLYDVAADAQLSGGQFAQAVHLYQLSKCPQLKRVAHFMGYGFLSELIAYIQVLFTTKSVEIVSADKCHFANIALHCFAHEVKNKLKDRHLINITFKKFLKENAYYDEEVAVKLLSEQGLCELLYYFARVRGQHGLMIETLFSTDGMKSTVNDSTYSALSSSGYQTVLQLTNDEHYIKCMTSLDLLQFLAAKPPLLNQHLQHLITLLPSMDISLLYCVALLYDPSHPMLKLCFKNLASSKLNKRYWSLSSLVTITNEVSELNKEEVATVDDVIKFFIFVLLMLCHKLDSPKFCLELVEKTKYDQIYKTPLISNLDNLISDSEMCVFDHSPISCGHSHVAYLHNGTLYTWGKSGSGRLGTDDMGTEYQTPMPVLTFLRLQVNVLAVSCGALHTLALTEFGTFAWGSSRYGQLGIGEVQQTGQPRIIENLLSENIIKIQCGQYHSIALTSNGRVLTWGWGIHGQLGHGNAEDLMFPKLIDSLKKKQIISVSAGQGHTVVLTKYGDVYTFGCGMFGQLGTGSVLKQSIPQIVNIPERIKLISSGYFHVLAVSRINKIYSWGCNPQALRLQAQNSRRARHHGSSSNYNSGSSHTSSSSLGSLHRTAYANDTIQQSHLQPNLVNSSAINDAIIEVSCGSHHSVLVTSCGSIFSWGRNSEGQIGNSTRKEQKTPNLVTTLKDRKVIHASCGSDFTIAVDSSGKLYGWGQNDGGQVGQKPSLEPNSKYNSGSSSGRVITIRTNRRMITITQPCRQSMLRPVEIAIAFYDMKNPGIFDSGSFESEYSVLKLLRNQIPITNNSVVRSDFDLSKLDKPSYGPFALHAALEAFHLQCDSTILLNYCLSFGNFQAAAKLSDLENVHDKALEYQLEALALLSNSCADMQMTLYIINFYSNFLEPRNLVPNQQFLCHVIRFWIQNSLPIPDLEYYFESHKHIFTYPLGLIMFKDECPSLDLQTHSQFLNLSSTTFCLNVMHSVLKQVQQGFHLINILEEMDILSNTTNKVNKIQTSDALNWDDTISQDHLWLDIMHNLQAGMVSNSSIVLSANAIDLLSKSLLSEKFYMQSFNNVSNVNRSYSNGNDAVVFSCGHHYTIPTFQTNIMAILKEFLQTLFYSVPETFKLLLSEYHNFFFTAACPKCVISEMSNEL